LTAVLSDRKESLSQIVNRRRKARRARREVGRDEAKRTEHRSRRSEVRDQRSEDPSEIVAAGEFHGASSRQIAAGSSSIAD
jgi:hypothetical protein